MIATGSKALVFIFQSHQSSKISPVDFLAVFEFFESMVYRFFYLTSSCPFGYSRLSKSMYYIDLQYRQQTPKTGGLTAGLPSVIFVCLLYPFQCKTSIYLRNNGNSRNDSSIFLPPAVIPSFRSGRASP